MITALEQKYFPSRLQDLYDDDQFEDEGHVKIIMFKPEAKENGSSALLQLELSRGREPDPPELYKIRFEGLHSYSVLPTINSYIEITDVHARLHDVNEDSYSLYIKKRPRDPLVVLEELASVHATDLDSQLPLTHYFGSVRWLLMKLSWDFGLFGTGPKAIFDQYRDVLDKAGAEPYYLDKPLIGLAGRDTAQGAYKILLIGSCHFIFCELEFTYLSKGENRSK